MTRLSAGKIFTALSHIFRADSRRPRAGRREFVRHVQSAGRSDPEIGYIQTGGGKRIRPAVLLMAARMSGYTGERAVLYAAVVEFIHTATLVHDDIIDGPLRRGRPRPLRWGNTSRSLLGDYLYLKSMALALTAGPTRHHPAAVRRDARA